MTGVCKYCGQTRLVSDAELKDFYGAPNIEVDDDMLADMLDIITTNKCKCPQAEDERRKTRKLEAAGAWIENYFQDRPDASDAMKRIVDAICRGVFGRISVKEGKRNYTVDLDSDECIRIRTKFTDTNEETF